MVLADSLIRIGWLIRDLRRAVGWSQRELARRAGVSQALVSAIERGRVENVSVGVLEALLAAMGGELVIDATRPFLGDRQRQREPAHVLCVNQVMRRLQSAGWATDTEVEVGGDRSRGWVDVLAFHPATGVVLVIEVKTEIHDLGAIERSLGWYERESWAAARRRGWQPRHVTGALILLATEANDARLRENRDAIARGFPLRAAAFTAIVSGARVAARGRAVAMVDPRSKRKAWLRPTRLDGRRAPAPYLHYADFMGRVRAGSRQRDRPH